MAYVAAVCTSTHKGTRKNPCKEIHLLEDFGIAGDAHAGKWHRQVSLLADESVDKLRYRLPNLSAGAFAENILTKGICLYTLPIGTQFQIGDVIMELTQIGKECHASCEIRKLTGDCVMPREGVFTKVLKGGTIHPGDEIKIIKCEVDQIIQKSSL